ncbi:MAG: calcium-binding protein [Patescibacteria group bacterium]|nr:calcium-binding protein [Patescibacteria group bacterium]
MINNKNLESLIDEATVDCFGPYEEVWGFQATMDNELIFPFNANISGKQVEVLEVDVKNDKLVAIYKRGNKKYTADILKLVYDPKQVDGSEWIEAYRQWFKDNECFFKRQRRRYG